MPVPRRIARLQQLILEVAAETVLRRMKDPRLGFVTLTRCKLAPDLSQATVFWSCLGTDAQRRTTSRALVDAVPFVQSVVAKALATRTTPTLAFRYDGTVVNAARLESIFETLRKERGEPPADAPPEAPADGDTDADDADTDEDDGAEDDANDVGDDAPDAAADAAGDGGDAGPEGDERS